jgi:iron complex transport system ATP-binding protein
VKPVPALELRNVSYVAERKRIIDCVNWTVGHGEHWAILGPNGSGKTTLLKLACGYLWPNAGGEIYRNGKILTNLPRLRRSIGWVTSGLAAQIPTEEPAIRTVLSGKFAQIGYIEGFGDEAGPRDFRSAKTALQRLGVYHLRQQTFGSLSQGEQQRVLIARALMTKPYLMVLDEPCAGMDPGAREIFLSALSQLGSKKKVPSLIYVTHHIEEILPLFKKTVVLKDGKILLNGSTRAVLQDSVLKKLYGVDVELIRRKGRFWPVMG